MLSMRPAFMRIMRGWKTPLMLERETSMTLVHHCNRWGNILWILALNDDEFVLRYVLGFPGLCRAAIEIEFFLPNTVSSPSSLIRHE